MNPIRPFKFEKLASCSCCCASAPVVALGDDQGLTIAQLVEKYGASLFGDHHAAVEQLPALIGKVSNFEAAEAVNVDDHYELDYKIPCSGVISRPAASTSCRSFFITSAGIHLRSTLTVRTRLRLRTMSIGA